MLLAPSGDAPKPSGLKVPPRLQRPPIAHLLRTTAGRPGPLAFGAHGPPGNGKTTGVLGTLRALGAVVFTADPTMFESVEAGEPPRRFKELYARAAAVRSPSDMRQPRPVALLLDDAHLLFGCHALTQYTVNTQHVHGLIQRLCDDPSLVFGRPMPRIPIFMTFNDADALPESLLRPGRMTLLHWVYTLEERVELLGRIFPGVDEPDLEHLVCEFVDEPLAFFADLRSLWAERHFRYSANAVRQTLRLALVGKWRVSFPPPTAKDLLALAREAVHARGLSPGSEEIV